MKPKSKGRRKQHDGIPKALREEVTRYARSIGKRYRQFFHADNKLKDRVARLVRVKLPPRRRRGRPDNPMVTHAIALHRRLCRKFPEESSRAVWGQVYPRVIVGYAEMSEMEQHTSREELRERVAWRRRKRRKIPRKFDV